MKSILSFARKEDKSDEWFKLPLFEAVLQKLGINYSLSEPIKEMELADHSYFWNARIIFLTKKECKKINRFYKKSIYPNLQEENEIISFFSDHKKEILDWVKTYHYFVEAYKNYIEGVKDLLSEKVKNKDITNLFKVTNCQLDKKLTEKEIALRIKIMKAIIEQLCHMVYYEIIAERRDW